MQCSLIILLFKTGEAKQLEAVDICVNNLFAGVTRLLDFFQTDCVLQFSIVSVD